MRRAIAISLILLLLYAGLVGALRAAGAADAHPVNAWVVCENEHIVGIIIDATRPGHRELALTDHDCVGVKPEQDPPRHLRPKSLV